MREKYRLKIDKKRFFFPKEWLEFESGLTKKQIPYFKIAINTGARINEIKHLKVKDINFDRELLTIYHSKIKATKKERRPQPRTFLISTQFAKWLKEFIVKNHLKDDDNFPIITTNSVKKCLNKKLKDMKIRDAGDFSSHNVRKTVGNWLLTWGIDSLEVAGRLGHDMQTMKKSYVSPNIFTNDDRIVINQILGNLINKYKIELPALQE